MDKKRPWYKETGAIVLVLLLIFVAWSYFGETEEKTNYDRKIELKEEVNSRGFTYIDGGNYSAKNLGLNSTGYGEVAFVDVESDIEYPNSSREKEEEVVIGALLAIDRVYSPDTYHAEINYDDEVDCYYYVPGEIDPLDYDISKESLVSLYYSESCEET